MTCTVEGCNKPIHNKTMRICYVHYHRFYRHGSTDNIKPKATRRIHSGGYVLIPARGHPLASHDSHGYEHRIVYYNVNGNGPFNCHWCGLQVTWKTLHIDHLDDVKTNNSIDNLVASCPTCNQQRGFEKQKNTWRKKSGITYNGETRTPNEWADIVGISRNALLARLRTMPIEKAMTMPRGVTGPKSLRFPDNKK